MVPCIIIFMCLDQNHCELQGAPLHCGWTRTLSFLWRSFSGNRISPPGSIKSHIIVICSGRSNKQEKHSQTQRVSTAIHVNAVVSIPLLLSSFSCRLTQRALLLRWSWIIEIDYAVTSQIPLPRAWPQSVWLQVGQACLRDALLAAVEEGQRAALARKVMKLPTVANERESLTLAGRNEDVLLKIPESSHHHPSGYRLFSPPPTSRHHSPGVICLYQCTMLMTASLTTEHSSQTSVQILGDVLRNFMRCEGTSCGFEYLCLITYKRHMRVIHGEKMGTLIP